MRRHIGRDHRQDDDHSDGANKMSFVLKFRGKHVWHRDRIVVIAKPLQTPGYQPPRQCDADNLADNDPIGLRADSVSHAGQTE